MTGTPRNSKIFDHARKARQTGLFAVLGKDGPASGIADLGALLVSGADAGTFLHSQLTNEVNALKPGEGNLSARVTRTGALLRWFSLHYLPGAAETTGGGSAFQAEGIQNSGLEARATFSPAGGDARPTVPRSYMLLLEREGIAPLRADLEKFAISDDVAFEDVSEKYDWLAIQGPAAPLLLEDAAGKLPDGRPWFDLPENSVWYFLGQGLPAGTLAFVRSLTGDSGYILAIPSGAAARPVAFKRIGEAAQKHKVGYLEGSSLANVLEILRIEAGFVRVGVDAPEGKLVLPETGLEQQVVSYSKGCYLGQEAIARIRTYGSVPNVLRGLVFDVAPKPGENPDLFAAGSAVLEKLPAPGADLFLEDGKKAGQIASRSLSPVLEAPVAFAYLDRANRTPGTRLKLRAKSQPGSLNSEPGTLAARVTLLPFYRAADTKARVSFLHDRAIRLFAENQDAKAVQMLEEALRLDPSFADGYEALGVILGRSGRFNEAIDIFKRLEEVAPNEPMVHTNLSLFYMKLGDKTAAEEEKAKATVKQFSRFGAMKGEQQRTAADEARKKEDALRKKAMFEEVLEIDPEDPIALFGLGNALSALADWPGAEKALAKACAASKDNSACFLAHGKALEMLNRESEAVAVYRAGMAVASKKGDLMPLKEMERRVLLLEATVK